MLRKKTEIDKVTNANNIYPKNALHKQKLFIKEFQTTIEFRPLKFDVLESSICVASLSPSRSRTLTLLCRRTGADECVWRESMATTADIIEWFHRVHCLWCLQFYKMHTCKHAHARTHTHHTYTYTRAFTHIRFVSIRSDETYLTHFFFTLYKHARDQTNCMRRPVKCSLFTSKTIQRRKNVCNSLTPTWLTYIQY